MSTLYLVATPIGNLEDFSPRAQRILTEVSLIAAEDTRHSRKLLSHYDIHTSLTSFFDHSDQHKLDKLLAELAQKAQQHNANGIKEVLADIIPEYKPDLEAISVVRSAAISNDTLLN